MQLGVSPHRQSIYRILRRFDSPKRKLVEKKDFGFIAGVGNLHSVYYLTRYGAALIAEVRCCDLSEIQYPKGVHIFTNDYFHRIATIDVHISLRQWAQNVGAEVAFFDAYFDKTGSNRSRYKQPLRAKTRIDISEGYFVPDAIYLYYEPDGKPYLATVEVHNGRDTGRFMKQMEQHLVALEEGAISLHYGLEYANRIQWVFEREQTMNAAIRRMQRRNDLEGFRVYVGFNTIANVRKGFADGWERF